jgi:hypothetical protein
MVKVRNTHYLIKIILKDGLSDDQTKLSLKSLEEVMITVQVLKYARLNKYRVSNNYFFFFVLRCNVDTILAH